MQAPTHDPAMGHAAAQAATLAARLAQWALPLVARHSTDISLAHLRAAATGQGAADLHHLLAGLGRDPGWSPEAHLRAPLFRRHTSGWDALAGLQLAHGALLPALET